MKLKRLFGSMLIVLCFFLIACQTEVVKNIPDSYSQLINGERAPENLEEVNQLILHSLETRDLNWCNKLRDYSIDNGNPVQTSQVNRDKCLTYHAIVQKNVTICKDILKNRVSSSSLPETKYTYEYGLCVTGVRNLVLNDDSCSLYASQSCSQLNDDSESCFSRTLKMCLESNNDLRAIRDGNVNLCGEFSWSCPLAVASRTGNISICKDSFCRAVSSGDPKQCETFSEFGQNKCRTIIAFSNKNSDSCLTLSEESKKMLCIIDLGLLYGDEDICKKGADLSDTFVDECKDRIDPPGTEGKISILTKGDYNGRLGERNLPLTLYKEAGGKRNYLSEGLLE